MAEPQKTQLSPQQVAMAAAAGQKLLQVDDLPVPLEIAKSGALGILEGILGAIATGQLVLGAPPEDASVGVPPAPEGGDSEE